MPAIEWRQRRDALAQKLRVMRHFAAKCVDAAKKAAIQKEIEAVDTDFKKSEFMVKASEFAGVEKE